MAILADDELDAPTGTFFTTSLQNGNTLHLVLNRKLGIVTSQEYDSNNALVGEPIQLLDGLTNSDIAIGAEYFDDGSYLLSFSKLSVTASQPQFQNIQYRFDASGTLTDTSTSIPIQTGYSPRTDVVELSNGGHVEITTYGQDPSGHALQSVFAADGSLILEGTEFNFLGSVSRASVHGAALEDGRYAITWKQFNDQTFESKAYVQVFNADGSSYSDPLYLNSGVTDGFMPNQVTLLSNGKFVVGDRYLGSTGYVANAHIFNADGSLFNTVTNLHFDDLSSINPSTAALSDGGFVTAWLEGGFSSETRGDIYVERFNASGNAVGDVIHVADIGDTASNVEILTLSDNGWVIFWSDGLLSNASIFQQAYDSDGNAIGKPVRVTNEPTAVDISETSALADGGWTVTLDNGLSRTFHIDAENHAPLVFDKTMTIGEDTNIAFNSTNFNAYDSDGDAITGFEITDLEVNGSFSLGGKAVQVGDVITSDKISRLHYVPTSNLSGEAMLTFDLKAIDANGAKSVEAAHYVIDVKPLSDGPVSKDVHRTIYENGSYHFQQSDFAFSDVDGDSLKSIRLATAQHGSFFRDGKLVKTSIPTIAYSEIEHYEWRPDKGYARENGNQVHFTLVDSGKNKEHEQYNSSANYNFDIDVLAVNHAPKGKNLSLQAPEDTAFKFSPELFGFKDSDRNSFKSIIINNLPEDGDLMLGKKHVVAGQEIAAGSLSKLIWNPDDNDYGTSLGAFSFHVRDNGGTKHGGVDISAASYTVKFAIKNVPETINGTSKNDTLIGTKGNDIINGLAGSDQLNGGRGNDIMTGGAGRDTFAAMNGGDDIIMDFDHSGADHDRIDLHTSKIFLVFSDIEQVLHQSGKDVQVSIYFDGDQHESLVVKNTHVSDLTADMFIF